MNRAVLKSVCLHLKMQWSTHPPPNYECQYLSTSQHTLVVAFNVICIVRYYGWLLIRLKAYISFPKPAPKIDISPPAVSTSCRSLACRSSVYYIYTIEIWKPAGHCNRQKTNPIGHTWPMTGGYFMHCKRIQNLGISILHRTVVE